MLKTLLKILLWTLLALVLFAAGSLMALVNILQPERLTPIVVDVANRALNADVAVGRIELSMRKSWPFVNMDVDSLVIVSRDISKLEAASRDTLPAWADTLVRIGKMHAGLNIAKLAVGQISLSDLELTRPQLNLLVVNDSLNNFGIAKPSAEEKPDTAAAKIPDIRIRSFRIIDPKELRYADMTTGLYAVAQLDTMSVVSQQQADGIPRYRATLNTNISSPMFDELVLDDISVGFDGTVLWRYDLPYAIKLTDFTFALNQFSGILNTEVDFSDELAVQSLDLQVHPIGIADVLALLSPKAKECFNIPEGISTDIAVGIAATLTQPFVAGADSLPSAQVRIEIPESWLRWGKIDIRKFTLSAAINTVANDLPATSIAIDNLAVAGPATTIAISGMLTSLHDDPLFEGRIDGRMAIEKLPPELTKWLHGAWASGTISLNSDVSARPSMFSRDGFHRLRLKGALDAKELYYVAPDTQTMCYVQKAQLKFGTHEKIQGAQRSLDSLLTARVMVDSSQFLVSGIKMEIGKVQLGIGALNTAESSDTTLVIPMGGRLQVKSFSLTTLSDTAGMRLRDLDGAIAMRRYQGNTKLPMFTLRTKIGRISAGDKTTRFVVSGSQLNVRMNKLANEELPQGRRRVKEMADSLHRLHPELPIDSVYVMALRIRRSHSTGHHRVHADIDSLDNEIINWGTTSTLRKLLLDWNLSGTLNAERARLFTNSFPVRNRVRNFNVTFNNDSIMLTNIEYKAGHSDFLVSGTVTNMKRAFTSRRPQPLKVNFTMLSDTIEVNEIAKAFFTGSSAKKDDIGHLTDEELEKRLEEGQVLNDTIGPFLIPVNIDAQFKMKANNVIYSDIILHDLQGTALAYDGALNLNQLQASSEVGSIDLSALYSAPSTRDMKFGFAMKLDNFNIKEFLKLVPAIDSVMPMIHDLGGIIDAQIAATSDVDTHMDLELPTLQAVVNLKGDSLVLLNEKTYKTIAKWLMFKDKNDNMIDSVSVNLAVKDGVLHLYPFIFNFDRYRLGVQGYNDMDMNFDYHVAVLKSPIPFKFGINIKGNPDKYKIRLGRARFNEKQSIAAIGLADTTRINLIGQFENVFRRGVRNSEFAHVRIGRTPEAANIDLSTDTISAADSLYLRNQGLLPTE